MNSEVLSKAKSWADNSYIDQADRTEIQALIDANDETELAERFHQDLEFGTGGLRSILGIGSNRMNKYNARKATQAFCNVIKKYYQQDLKVAISFDSRNQSPELAKEVATVFAANEVKTFLYNELTPVPMLSYAVRNLKCQGGVMVTASHNPKNYNGYKAFWSHGGQVVPPQDQEIIQAYNQIQSWDEISSMDFNEAKSKEMIVNVPETTIESYYQVLEDLAVDKEMIKNNGDKLNIVYTPIHGTGLKPVSTICERLGFTNFQVVESQAQPDSKFPTVEFPNPEYPEALKLAVEQMQKTGADLVMGSDPDTDRLGVATIHNGEVVYINGNQIGVLMVEYLFQRLSDLGKLPKSPLVIKSIMTSEMQTAVAQKFGGTVMNTLTGFKWMGSLYTQLEQENSPLQYVFASEESFGYMPHKEVRDKDGVASVSLFAELALYHKLQGRNIVEALEHLYQSYGFYQESLLQNVYEGLSGKDKIQKIMNHFREEVTTSFCGDEIESILDIAKGTKTFSNGDSEKIDLPSSNVLGLTFKNGNKLYLRPSGTEPKIKFYSLVQVHEGDLASKKSKAAAIIESWESEIQQICNRF